MTVRVGREFLAVPGPTNEPDEVLQAMHCRLRFMTRR
jgi:alanine-glyoxylate transaminase/serine-glyoxylate transaminase/serine-pyruvate transaminase